MTGINKRFGDSTVLNSVNFTLHSGEIHALVGQNGAGKSSLMKVLAGVYVPDGGTIAVDGEVIEMTSPVAAHEARIRMVFQGLSLVPQLTVAQSVVLGNEIKRIGLLDDAGAIRLTKGTLAQLDVNISPTSLVSELRVGDRQLVEIAKALSQSPKILVLDEPSSSLSRQEVDRLFAAVSRLRDAGLGIVFISHHMQEITELCNRVTILRDGEVVGLLDGEEVEIDAIIARMLPDTLSDAGEAVDSSQDRQRGAEVLRVSDLRAGPRVQGVSLDVAAGETVGIAGLLGSGSSEFFEALFGLRSIDGGSVNLSGADCRIYSPADAIKSRIMLITDDRHTTGIISGHSVAWNMMVAVWAKFSRFGWVRDRMAEGVVRDNADRLKIKMSGIDGAIENLSGGNQQKVLVARALLVAPRLLLLNGPTVGIDVRARVDINEAVSGYVGAGGAAIWVSSDMQELAENCDRVYVMRQGRFVQLIHSPTEQELVAAIQKESTLA